MSFCDKEQIIQKLFSMTIFNLFTDRWTSLVFGMMLLSLKISSLSPILSNSGSLRYWRRAEIGLWPWANSRRNLALTSGCKLWYLVDFRGWLWAQVKCTLVGQLLQGYFVCQSRNLKKCNGQQYIMLFFLSNLFQTLFVFSTQISHS